MVTIRAYISGSNRYYKCDNYADAEALLQAFAVAKIEADYL